MHVDDYVEMIKALILLHPDITSIFWEPNDESVWFWASENLFSPTEFDPDSPTAELLEKLAQYLLQHVPFISFSEEIIHLFDEQQIILVET